MILRISIFVCLLGFFCATSSIASEVTFTLGPLGPIKGKTTQTKYYPDAPYSNRPYYKFRNIPYIEGSVSGENRFRQSSVRTSPYSEDNHPYDATKSGPLCMQGTLGTLHIDSLLQQSLEDFILSLLSDNIGDLIPRTVVEVLLRVIEILVEVPAGTLGGKKSVVEVLHDWLDIDLSVEEDCLSLAVWTPWKPTGEEMPNLPVMYYLFGGGFNSGFSYRMGAERFGSFEDVVVVAINYRLGPLGFLCLDTDEAAGNMALLDMVVGLEWVQNYISYFGGDPNRVTLFGESAGSASLGHLMLSPEAAGLFSQAIGSSGSAIASWAFESQQSSEVSSRNIAARVDCHDTNPDDLVECLRQVDAADIAAAFSSFQAEERGNASMGYSGTMPCGQTKGERKFYTADLTPTDILFSGDYRHVPVMYGATKDEGSFVYETLYNEYMIRSNLSVNEHFLRYELIPTLMKTVGVDNYYPLKELLLANYFDPWMVGDVNNMVAGFTDLLSVFFIKSAAYELVQQNSKYSPSYWYAFDYDNPEKKLYNVFFLGYSTSNVTHPGATHCEEIPYLFDVEIPLIFCNIEEIINDALECLSGLDAIFCLTLPNGQFRSKWHNCLTGQFSEEELQVSSNTVQAWTNFAARGYPGFGVGPWTTDDPVYLKIDKVNSVQTDFTKEYHIALEEFRNRTGNIVMDLS